MKIDSMTIGEIKEIQSILGNKEKPHPWKIGEKYLIWTVTMIQVVILTGVYETELTLDKAAWIADTGRFETALKEGIDKIESSEIEMFSGEIIVGRGAIIDAVIYNPDLPTSQKSWTLQC